MPAMVLERFREVSDILNRFSTVLAVAYSFGNAFDESSTV